MASKCITWSARAAGQAPSRLWYACNAPFRSRISCRSGLVLGPFQKWGWWPGKKHWDLIWVKQSTWGCNRCIVTWPTKHEIYMCLHIFTMFIWLNKMGMWSWIKQQMIDFLTNNYGSSSGQYWRGMCPFHTHVYPIQLIIYLYIYSIYLSI